jgi:dTMP kinase
MKVGVFSIVTWKRAVTVLDQWGYSIVSDDGHPSRGLFVTFEGIDGSGKSTLARLVFRELAEELGADRLIMTYEPGGWDGGESLRAVILGRDLKNVLTETLLFLADRTEHVERVIRPGLESGKVVLCERYSDSTLAYQVFGKNFPREIVENIRTRADFPEPDVTFWLDVPVKIAMKRIVTRKGDPDRFEKDGSLLERIKIGYGAIGREDPGRFKRLDGTMGPKVLSNSVASTIMDLIKRKKDAGERPWQEDEG